MKKKKIKPKHDPIDTGTPETRAKLSPDPILALFNAGRINGTHLHCAEEICLSRMLLTAPVSLKFFNPDRVVSGGNFAENETTGNIQRQRFYTKWCGEIRHERMAFDPVESVVIDRNPIRWTERKFKMRSGTCSGLVVRALDMYARIAGMLPGVSRETMRIAA